MAKVLVTGGAGFIGSHCVDMLLRENYEVVVLDILPADKARNLTHCMDAITYIEGDVRDLKQTCEAMEGCDRVVHFAAIVSVPLSMEDPVGSHNTNVTGTLNVFEAARLLGVTRVVYASSAAVYGDLDRDALCESDITTPLSPYGWHKVMNEQYADLYCRQFGVEMVGLRFFNVYGSRQDPTSPYSGVITIFKERLIKNEPLVIFGDGGQTRDFVHVADVVATCVAFLGDQEPVQGVYNVGTGKAVTIKAVATTMIELFNPDQDITYKEAREGDIARSCADTTKLQAYLGLAPQTDIANGLRTLETS